MNYNNGRLRIMLLGDPHSNPKVHSDRDKACEADYANLLNAACEKLKPDMAVFMGDNAYGETREEFESVIERITAPLCTHNIPFAFVLGNHDLQHKFNSIEGQYDCYRNIPGCLTAEATFINRSDYYLTIKDSDGQDSLILWFVYSGDSADKEYYSYYDYVHPDQNEAYEKAVLTIKEKNRRTVPAILFQHIPVCEELRLFKRTGPLSMLLPGLSGLNGQYNRFFVPDKKNTDFYGYAGECPCCPDYNGRQFDSWKRAGDIFAAFFGHDHMNDFTGTVDGILLGQCKLTSFRAYGDGMRQGVRIIDVFEYNPKAISTRMYHYRQLVGSNCNSIHGETKYLPDRYSVRLELLLKIIGASAAMFSPAIIKHIIKKKPDVE